MPGATPTPDPAIEEALFRIPTNPPGPEELRTILELYKLYVGTMEALVSRRQTVHTFFLTASSFLLTAAGLLLTKDYINSGVSAVPVMVASLAGALLSLTWMSLSLRYERFNKKKFDVIHAFERRLPAEPFRAEWLALGEGRKPRIYGPMAAAEGRVPVVFLFIYVVMFVIGVVIFAGHFRSGERRLPTGGRGPMPLCISLQDGYQTEQSRPQEPIP